MIIDFGKHRGKSLNDLPISYLQWLLDDCSSISPAMRSEIKRIIRESNESESPRQTNALSVPTIAPRWYRTLAIEFHPDKRNGSHEGMKAINRAKDLLLEMAGCER